MAHGFTDSLSEAAGLYVLRNLINLAQEPEIERKELTPEERAEKLAKLEELRIQKKLEREEREKKVAILREKRFHDEICYI